LKLHSQAIGAKAVPEAAFGFTHIHAEQFSAAPRHDVPSQGSPSPCPLPLKGERGFSTRHVSIPIESSKFVNA
jgi:hypothetical protein